LKKENADLKNQLAQAVNKIQALEAEVQKTSVVPKQGENIPIATDDDVTEGENMVENIEYDSLKTLSSVFGDSDVDESDNGERGFDEEGYEGND